MQICYRVTAAGSSGGLKMSVESINTNKLNEGTKRKHVDVQSLGTSVEITLTTTKADELSPREKAHF